MRTRSRLTLTLASALFLVTSACKQSEPPPKPATTAPPPVAAVPPPPAPVAFKVVSVDLGRAVGADKRVAQPAGTFASSDTIYASVVTEGVAPSVALSARWTYGDEGQLVNESSQTIAPTGPAATEFHIVKPSGWPTGKYKVEVSANGAVVASRDFVVN